MFHYHKLCHLCSVSFWNSELKSRKVQANLFLRHTLMQQEKCPTNVISFVSRPKKFWVQTFIIVFTLLHVFIVPREPKIHAFYFHHFHGLNSFVVTATLSRSLEAKFGTIGGWIGGKNGTGGGGGGSQLGSPRPKNIFLD